MMSALLLLMMSGGDDHEVNNRPVCIDYVTICRPCMTMPLSMTLPQMLLHGSQSLLRYMALLQKAVNNQVDMITIELDDVETFCKKDPSILVAFVG